jgi:hypothetical protein
VPPTTSAKQPTHGARGRFASPAADLEERVVDYQAELDCIAQDRGREIRHLEREIDIDERRDQDRFRHYQFVERAIRRGSMREQLDAFHALVTHVEADELREDECRRGRIPALELLAAKIVELRRIFHDDFAPRILAAYAKGGDE